MKLQGTIKPETLALARIQTAGKIPEFWSASGTQKASITFMGARPDAGRVHPKPELLTTTRLSQ